MPILQRGKETTIKRIHEKAITRQVDNKNLRRIRRGRIIEKMLKHAQTSNRYKQITWNEYSVKHFQ